MQPMKDIYAKAIAAENAGEVLNASIFGCFPLADIPHVGLSAIVVADGDKDGAERLLYDIMQEGWERRDEFVFPVEPIEKSVSEAKALDGGPVILSDHGDNTGSGGNQDVMAVLAEVIHQDLDDVCAGPFCDPAPVAQTFFVDAQVSRRRQLHDHRADVHRRAVQHRPLRRARHRQGRNRRQRRPIRAL